MNTTRARLLALRQKIDPKHTAEMAHLQYIAGCLAHECSKYSGALRRTPGMEAALQAMQRSVAEVSR